jgi:hypothetical protein
MRRGSRGSPTESLGSLISAWGFGHQYAIDRVRAHYPRTELVGSSSASEMSLVLGFREDYVASSRNRPLR